MNQVPWLKPWPRWEYAKPIEAPFLQSLPSLRWFYALAGNIHVPVLGWVWRMRTVCSNDSEQSLYHVRLLACFACVPNAESTNGMAHMQQSFFLSSEIATLCEANRLVVDSAAFASWYFDSARMAEPPTKWSWTGPRQSIQASRSCNSLCRWVNASVSSTGLLHVRLQWRHGSYFFLHGHVVQERWVAKCPHSKMPKLRHSCRLSQWLWQKQKTEWEHIETTPDHGRDGNCNPPSSCYKDNALVGRCWK